ncbi:MAG: CHASE2 domain-containing protein [Melioribacteraceae bacterium]|nr:CHASE2 domain-containing protein [Melioribacteraceae bacterium]
MKWSFKIDSLIITILIFIIIWLFSIIPYKLIFLDPIAKAAGDFDLNDIVFSKLYPEQSVDTNIVLVNIGQLSRTDIAKQINLISSYNPKVIGLDVIFANSENSESDSAVAKALNNVKNLVLVGILDNYSENGDYYNKYFIPDSNFSKNAVMGYANLPTKFGASSKTIRSFRPYSRVKNNIVSAFALRIVEIYDMDAYKILLSRSKDEEVINYRGNIDKFITLDTDVLYKSYNLNFLKDKIVLLGFLGNSLSEKTLEDIYFTPLNEVYAGRSYPDMYGITIHANIVSMLINNNFIDTVSPWISSILAFIVCLINVYYIRKVRSKLTDYYGGIAKLLIFTQTTIILIINVLLFLYLGYKMSFTLMLVGLIFIPSTVILYDNLIKNVYIKAYSSIKGRIKS